MTEDELRDLQEEYRMDAQEDRRYENRSAEEILGDIASDFMDSHGDILEDAYGKLCSELGDYGLETCCDDIFENVLEDCSQFKSPYVDDNRSLRKRLKAMEEELGSYRFKFGLLEDKQ